MSKLIRLREWLTLPEAARYLSGALSEEIGEADVLRLGLDGRLKLSVFFRSKVTVCTVGSELISDYGPLPIELQHLASLEPHASDLRVGKETTIIDGVWDLPLIGADRDMLEGEFSALTGGDGVWTAGKSVFVDGPDGRRHQLQEPQFKRSGGRRLRQDGQFLRDADTGEILARFKLPASMSSEGLPDWGDLESDRFPDVPEGFFTEWAPAMDFPDDAELVVRTSALLELQDVIANQGRDADRPLGVRAETTYLNIIGALLGLLLGKAPSGKPYSSFASQSAIIDALESNFPGVEGVKKRTLEEKFARAKESLGPR